MVSTVPSSPQRNPPGIIKVQPHADGNLHLQSIRTYLFPPAYTSSLRRPIMSATCRSSSMRAYDGNDTGAQIPLIAPWRPGDVWMSNPFDIGRIQTLNANEHTSFSIYNAGHHNMPRYMRAPASLSRPCISRSRFDWNIRCSTTWWISGQRPCRAGLISRQAKDPGSLGRPILSAYRLLDDAGSHLFCNASQTNCNSGKRYYMCSSAKSTGQTTQELEGIGPLRRTRWWWCGGGRDVGSRRERCKSFMFFVCITADIIPTSSMLP